MLLAIKLPRGESLARSWSPPGHESCWPTALFSIDYFEVQQVAILIEVFLTHKFDEKPAYRIPFVRTMI